MDRRPVTIILFGATGDLSKHKLLPALFDLYSRGAMPFEWTVLGISRKDLLDEDFKKFVNEAIGQNASAEFLEHFKYFSGDIADAEMFKNVAKRLEEIDTAGEICSHKLFYLAVSPDLFANVLENISIAGLSMPCASHDHENIENSWARILIEKPFGRDLVHAEELDKLITKLFDDSQIYRVDHFIAKETVQNILTFRFINSIFEPVWNSEYVESVCIRFFEKDGIRKRGAFYDSTGALRDVGQNHMLQLLALVAMEDPHEQTSEAMRKARADVLSHLKPFDDDLVKNIVKGQYVGYKDVEGVANDSQTETFSELKLGVDNNRWKGTPFYLEFGKALHTDTLEIVITFRERASMLTTGEHEVHQNRLTICIQPCETISLEFWAKRPGFDFMLDKKVLAFEYDSVQGAIPGAYERVIFDVLRGDQTLFTSNREVLEQWRLIMPLYEKWNTIPLIEYAHGATPEEIVQEAKFMGNKKA